MKKFPCTSSTLALHVLRAFFQVSEWTRAPFYIDNDLDPLKFGYSMEDGPYKPIIVSGERVIPEDFPTPCNCVKCFRDKTCRCRSSNRSCCEFCNCGGKKSCCNPFNQVSKCI